MRTERYQIALIGLSIVVMGFLSVFIFRELFPEYKVYQNRYITLENWLAEQRGQTPPPFKKGIKQVVLYEEAGRAPRIDRCSSCHLALELPHFSPTRVSRDINGNIRRDKDGIALLEENPNYVWKKIEEKIADLRDEKVNEHLRQEGNEKQVQNRLDRASELEKLFHVDVDHRSYDMKKLLKMHPLIGRETRPFELHPIEEFGCSTCHNGNGRSLTTKRAHGPVFSGEYEAHSHGPEPQFQESDGLNDPQFSKIFNDKPGDKLLFQTTPLFLGGLVEASCAQCHNSSDDKILKLTEEFEHLQKEQDNDIQRLEEQIQFEKRALVALLQLQFNLKTLGFEKTKKALEVRSQRKDLSKDERTFALSRWDFFLEQEQRALELQKDPSDWILSELDRRIIDILGSSSDVLLLQNQLERDGRSIEEVVDAFFVQRTRRLSQNIQKVEASVSELIEKKENLKRRAKGLDRNIKPILEDMSSKHQTGGTWESSIDQMIDHYRRGEGLFISQACYACHKISLLSRGAIGPELTNIGNSYPWYVKESIVWPQADLASSTMPNFRLDHEEIEDLMSFLMAQKGQKKNQASVDYKISQKQWESGELLPWERPLSPAEVFDLKTGYRVFATEGCASCHQLKGYKGQWGVKDTLQAHEWFEENFPKNISGRELAKKIFDLGLEFDQYVVAQEEGNLEEIEQSHRGTLESFYSSYKFAKRAYNHYFESQESVEGEDLKKLKAEKQAYLLRCERFLKAFIQHYGLGREIGPNLHWSGVYRSSQWLMGHFENPQAHVPKSIMPVMPFDKSKFQALSRFLQVLGKQNRDFVRSIWQTQGFDPEKAYEIHCASCHGTSRLGNGPVSQWIYPIPKNLRNATFLRNLTRERAVSSILHGVHGTPMAPWNEAPRGDIIDDGHPVLTLEEVNQLVDWLFEAIPGSIRRQEEIEKWNYSPEDVVDELQSDRDARGFFLKEELKAVKQSSLIPQLKEKNSASTIDIDAIFDKRENSLGQERYSYFIKERLYTEKNIRAGEKIFLEHCAHCHGSQAAGDGMRSVTMKEAKPRMLINIPWINSQDDLRLLRSIKYGVAGTAMISFADVTTAWQRIQLVCYIRSLTKGKLAHDQNIARVEERFTAVFSSITDKMLLLDQERASLEKRLAQDVDGFLTAQQTKQAVGEYTDFKQDQQRQSQLEKELQYYASLSELMLAQQDILVDLVSALAQEDEFSQEFRFPPLSSIQFLPLLDSHLVLQEFSHEPYLALLSTLRQRLSHLQLNLEESSGMVSSVQKREREKALQAKIQAQEKLLSSVYEAIAEQKEIREKLANLIATHESKRN